VPDYSFRFGIIETPTPYQTFSEGVIANPDARWETAVKNNVAIETGFFSNVFKLSFDYFWGDRRDIFMSAARRNIPPWFGAPPVAANLGSTKERGWELESIFNNRYNEVRISVATNLSFVTTETTYAEDPELMPDYQRNKDFPLDRLEQLCMMTLLIPGMRCIPVLMAW
jgi:hypothetical protein